MVVSPGVSWLGNESVKVSSSAFRVGVASVKDRNNTLDHHQITLYRYERKHKYSGTFNKELEYTFNKRHLPRFNAHCLTLLIHFQPSKDTHSSKDKKAGLKASY